MDVGDGVAVGTTVDGCSRPVRRHPFGARALLGGARRGACATFTWLHNRGTFVRARTGKQADSEGNWVNGRAARFRAAARLHHRARARRTSASSSERPK